MDASTTITIRTSKETKEKAQALFKDLGMDLSTAINSFLRQSIKEEALPFRPVRKAHVIFEDELTDEELHKLVTDAYYEAEKGNGIPAEEFFKKFEEEHGIKI